MTSATTPNIQPWHKPDIDALFHGDEMLSESGKWRFSFGWSEVHCRWGIVDGACVEVTTTDPAGFPQPGRSFSFVAYDDGDGDHTTELTLADDWDEVGNGLTDVAAIRWEATHPKLSARVYAILKAKFDFENPHRGRLEDRASSFDDRTIAWGDGKIAAAAAKVLTELGQNPVDAREERTRR
jgi:hypothetical protein